MTTPHPESFSLPAPSAPPPTQYDYVGGNPELDQLLAMEANLYAQSKEIGEQLAEVKDRLKIALTSITRQGGAAAPMPFERYRIALPGQVARVLRWKVSRRVDTARLKREQPDFYRAYSSESGAWYLEREK